MANTAIVGVIGIPDQTGNSGKYLTTNGSSVSFDPVDISTASVTGTLPVANGGTGAATLTGVLKGNGTGAITASAQLAVADGGTGVSSVDNIVAGKLKSATTDVSISAATAPSNGQVLMATSSTVATWQTPSPVTATAAAPTLVIINGPTTQNAAVNSHYVLETAAAITVTLPAGTSGDVIWITVANSRTDNVINVVTNSTSINGDATNLTLDNAYITLLLRHCGASSKWRTM